MRKIKLLTLVFVAMLSACASTVDTPRHKNTFYIEEYLLQPQQIPTTEMTAQEFDKLTLTQRFEFYAQAIIDLRKSLESANNKILDISKIIEKYNAEDTDK